MEEKIRKVFLDELPKTSKGINWVDSVGHRVKFIYNDTKSAFNIVEYNKKEQKCLILYKAKEKWIHTSHIHSCKFGNIGLDVSYKYNIGDIIKTKTGSIKILDQINVVNGKNSTRGYKYKCLVDGNNDEIIEYKLKNSGGCNVCHGKKVLKGYNDLWTTHPNKASSLLNPEDGYKYSYGSHKKFNWKCSKCNNIIKNKPIDRIVNQGLSCPKCSDGISYPEKIMFNVLLQLNIKYKNRYSPIWSKNIKHNDIMLCGDKIYDFYINSINSIVEVHGNQHYDLGFGTINNNNRNLQQEKENDILKKRIALNNEINNYIIIDARYSDLEYIKSSIINSKLAYLFDLRKINWIECEQYALNSFVKEACDLWHNGIKSTKEISEIMGLSIPTIIKYLKKGNNLELCDYSIEKVLKTRNNRLKTYSNVSKIVVCLTTKEIFKSLTKANIKYKSSNTSHISGCCKNKRKSSGKHPITGEPLKWMYYEDYIEKYGSEGLIEVYDNNREQILENIV